MRAHAELTAEGVARIREAELSNSDFKHIDPQVRTSRDTCPRCCRRLDDFEMLGTFSGECADCLMERDQ